MVEPEPKTFNKGLIFVKDTDILLSGDKWTIVINVALDDYEALIYNMKMILDQISQKLTSGFKLTSVTSFDIQWGEINRLRGIVQGLEMDLQGFRKLLFEEVMPRGNGKESARTKRGLLNVLGYGMKYLFGTADAHDVKRITDVCDGLQRFKEKMMHAVDHQLTYIRVLDESTKQNTKDITVLAETLRDSLYAYSLKLGRVEADLMDTQAAVIKQARYSAAIREIEVALQEMKVNMMQLQEAIDVTSLGQLSSVLINPYNLSVILQQVSLQLPAGLAMLTGLSVQEMYVYYTQAIVHAVATSKSIRLFVEIPLKASGRYFELYQAHSLPFLHEGINKFVMVDEPFTFLAVAESRQYFAMLTPYMLTKCTQKLFTVCPSDVILRTANEPNCLIALFLGKADLILSKCKRLVINGTFESVWIRSPDASYWIYSLYAPQRVTIQCQEVGSPPSSSVQILLNGTGILPNSSACYIYAENFKLLPHSIGRTEITLKKAHIVLLIIENVLTFNEEVVLQSEPGLPINLQHLNEISTRTASRTWMQGTDVTRLVDAIQDHKDGRQQTYWIWILCIVITVIIFGFSWFIWIRYIKGCIKIWRKNITATPLETLDKMSLDHKGNEHGTKLQVVQRDQQKETTLTTETEGTQQKSSLLTEFVQHGVLTSEQE